MKIFDIIRFIADCGTLPRGDPQTIYLAFEDGSAKSLKFGEVFTISRSSWQSAGGWILWCRFDSDRDRLRYTEHRLAAGKSNRIQKRVVPVEQPDRKCGC